MFQTTVIKRIASSSWLLWVIGIVVGILIAVEVPLPFGSTAEIPDLHAAAMVPPARNIDELVSGADVIIVGSVASVIDERRIGPYRIDGQGAVSEHPIFPVTDYGISVERVLKGDRHVASGGTLTLRQFGHLSGQATTSARDEFPMSRLGDHRLFVLGINPDGTYGLRFGPYSRFDIDGETVVYSDGIALPMRFASRLGPDQFERGIRDEVESQRGME